MNVHHDTFEIIICNIIYNIMAHSAECFQWGLFGCFAATSCRSYWVASRAHWTGHPSNYCIFSSLSMGELVGIVYLYFVQYREKVKRG